MRNMLMSDFKKHQKREKLKKTFKIVVIVAVASIAIIALGTSFAVGDNKSDQKQMLCKCSCYYEDGGIE
jgi:hypothetical protein